MTSVQSLRTKVNLKDFRRSFGNAIIPFAIALAVLFMSVTFPVISYILSEQYATAQEHNEILLFMSSEIPISFGMLVIGMAMCGVLMAIRQFSFLMSKKSVNVYLSFGMKRTTLYLNRILASTILIFISVFVPFTISYIINAVKFGMTQHLTNVYLYGVSSLFVAGFAGLAFGSFATMISGHVVEAFATAFSALLAPYFAAEAVRTVFEAFLKGYSSRMGENNGRWINLLSPFTFAINYNVELIDKNDPYTTSTPHHLFGLLENTGENGKLVFNEAFNVDMGFVMPVLVCLAIGSVMLLLGGILMKRRRAEHAASFGNFTLSRVIGSVFAFSVCATFVLSYFYSKGINGEDVSVGIAFAATLLITLVCCFLIQLIWTRSIKKTARSLGMYAVILVAFSFSFILAKTQNFGTYNKAPKLENVTSVSYSIFGAGDSYMYTPSRSKYSAAVNSEENSDFDTAVKLLDLAKASEDNDGYVQDVSIVFNLKNGEKMVREFVLKSANDIEEYEELSINSKLFDKVLETMLLMKPDKKDSFNDFYQEYSGYKGLLRATEKTTPEVNEPESDENYFVNDKVETDFSWLLLKPDAIFDKSVVEEIDEKALKCDEDFYKALYNDLSKMTYKDFCKNTEKPLYVLSQTTSPSMYFADITTKYDGMITEELEKNIPYVFKENILIYPQMKETIDYLNSKGYKPIEGISKKVKEVYITETNTSVEEATAKYAYNHKDEYTGYGKVDYFYANIKRYDFNSSDTSIYNMNRLVEDFYKEKTTKWDVLLTLYKDASQPLKKLDSEKAAKAVDASVNYYGTVNDKGRYIFIIYDNGMFAEKYIPEVNLNKI